MTDRTSGAGGTRGTGGDRRADPPGYQLPLLLLAGFRELIDRLHVELAAQGHPDLRPAHGFALQAIGAGGTTAAELGRRTGVSKQAAGKTIDRLVDLGYLERRADAADARRRAVAITERGHDALHRSAAILDRLRADWAEAVGAGRLADLETALRVVAGPAVLRVDSVAWLSAPG